MPPKKIDSDDTSSSDDDIDVTRDEHELSDHFTSSSSSDDDDDDDDDNDDDNDNDGNASHKSKVSQYEQHNNPVVMVGMMEYMRRKQQVDEYAFNYDAHKEWIEAVRCQHGWCTQYLRDARHHMASLFPLASSLWLQWLRDEVFLRLKHERATTLPTNDSSPPATPLPLSDLLQLFDTSLLDYLSM
jgi:hypothetical protein